MSSNCKKCNKDHMILKVQNTIDYLSAYQDQLVYISKSHINSMIGIATDLIDLLTELEKETVNE